jgi:hypothetical protein
MIGKQNIVIEAIAPGGIGPGLLGIGEELPPSFPRATELKFWRQGFPAGANSPGRADGVYQFIFESITKRGVLRDDWVPIVHVPARIIAILIGPIDLLIHERCLSTICADPC